MNAVKNNPYRTLGLFGNSTEKELQKQIATIKRFAEVGKTKSFDFDFPFLGEVIRDTEMVQEAASRIEQAKNKVHYALFWFLNNGHIDELALNILKEGNVEKAEEIWEKTLKDLTINNKNFSAASNLATLQLAVVTKNGSFDPEKFLSSIELKGKLLTSKAFNDFVSTVAGEGITINHDAALKDFIDEVLLIIKPFILKPIQKSGLIAGVSENGIGFYGWENGDFYFGEFKEGNRTGFGIYLWQSGDCYYGGFNSNNKEGEGIYIYPDGSKSIGKWVNGKYQKNEEHDSDLCVQTVKRKTKELKQKSGINFNYITTAQLINAFKSFPPEIRQYTASKFVDRPLNALETSIDSTRQKRDDNPSEAAKYGEELFNKTKSDVALLKNILGENNVQFQMILNKLAQEILQCSIDYFNELNDSSNLDPGDRALKLLNIAKSLNPTGQVKARIEENEEVIQEWVDEKPERERNGKIKTDLEFIGNKLNRFQDLTDTIANAKDLVVSCKPRLQNIKAALGPSDDLYLKISSAVVHNALNSLVSVVNEEQRLIQFDRSRFITLPTTIASAMEIMNLMSGMDMVYELRSRFNQNKTTISGIQSSINQITNSYSRTRTTSSSGCYIATMAYGHYDHPQVLVLRKYRDSVLSKSSIGIEFIKFYYKYSPILVTKLKDKPYVNKIIRSLLNIFISLIK